MPAGNGAQNRRAEVSRIELVRPTPTSGARHVPRCHLVALLDEQVALTLLLAPAGFGKTELVTEWTRATEERVEWLGGDSHDEVVTALLTAMGRSAADALSASAFPDEEARTATVVRILRQALLDGCQPQPVVIDNAQTLPAASVALLDRVLTTLPNAVRLILLSRRELPLPTVRLNLQGEFVLIRSSHLAFDEEEARKLIHLHAPNARRSEVTRLMERTLGWPAALTLAARTIDSGGSASGEATERRVLDYLLGESLEQLSTETRDLLVSVCHETSVTTDAAITLSGLPDAGDRLADLASRRVDGFLVTAHSRPGQNERVWELHPLLIEVLRHQAATSSREVSLAAHRRGAATARAEGRPERALHHAVLTGDAELLGDLLQDFGPDLIAAGQLDLVTRALHARSSSEAPLAPNLIGVEALVRHHDGDVRATFALLAELEQSLARQPRSGDQGEVERTLLLDLARLRLWRARLGWADLSEAIGAARSVIEEAGAAGSFATRVCNVLVKLTAAETWFGDLGQARAHATESLAAARALGYDRLTITALGHTALLDVIEGAMQSALDHATAGLELARSIGLNAGVDVGRVHLAAAWAHFHALEIDAAASELDEARRATGRTPDPLVELLSTVLQARLLIHRGRWLDAERRLASDFGATSHLPTYAFALVSLTRAHLAVVAGDHDRIAQEVALLAELDRPVEAAVLSGLEAALEGRIEDASAILDEVSTATFPDLVMRACVTSVRMALQILSGDSAAARATLDQLLSAVATHRLLLCLTWAAWAGDGFVDVLQEEVARPDGHPYAAEALRAMEQLAMVSGERLHPREDQTGVLEEGAALASAVTLTRREHEVFDQLALGASYADIAEALFVSENTIKTHVAAIYRKLGVDRRSESLRVGRELGLIGWPRQTRKRPQ